MWIPKATLANLQASEKGRLVELKGKNAQSKNNQCFLVPEKMLQAQGYYDGQASLWIPRALLQQKVPQTPSRPTKELSKQPKVQQQWRPTINVHTKPKAPLTVQKSMKWVPKSWKELSTTASTSLSLQEDVASTSQHAKEDLIEVYSFFSSLTNIPKLKKD